MKTKTNGHKIQVALMIFISMSGALSVKPENNKREELTMYRISVNTNDWRTLTPEEVAVMIHKGTEPPGSGF